MAAGPGDLAARLAAGSAAALRYCRSRLLGTWLALGLLALATGVLFVVADREGDINDNQTREIAMLADDKAAAAQEQNDDVVAYLRGEQGIPGVPGANGEDGSPGLPGQGEAGAAGERGPAGTQGPVGALGPVGPAGPAGAGTPGEPGPAGPAGPKGDTGPRGDKGDNGARGTAGADGADGGQGPPGVAGPAGPAGPPFTPSTLIAVGQSVNTPDSPKTANASCPAGSRASGGGFAVVPNDPGLITTASSPVGNTGWSATTIELSFPAAAPWQLLVFAVCVS